MVATGVPLVNTVILLTSGAMVTMGHGSMQRGNGRGGTAGLLGAVVLGVLITGMQGLEYKGASYAISDGVYGSTIYLATGAHGMHVIVGSVILGVCMCRAYAGHISRGHMLGYEAAAWYWHIVDVVWLCLYVLMYWWGT